MELGALMVVTLLIFIIISGIFGLFFYSNYIKKIACLASSYGSFFLLISMIFFKDGVRTEESLIVSTSLIIVFAINLIVGISFVKKF